MGPRLPTGGQLLVALRYTNPLHQPPVVVYDSVLCYSTANTLPYRPQVTFKGSYLGTKTPYGSHITQPLVVDHSACGLSNEKYQIRTETAGFGLNGILLSHRLVERTLHSGTVDWWR